jgi:hypothetical protein
MGLFCVDKGEPCPPDYKIMYARHSAHIGYVHLYMINNEHYSLPKQCVMP